MGKINRIGLLWKAIAILVLGFGLATVAVVVSSAWRVDRNLTAQFENRGRAIANSFANSSVEVFLFRDVSTAQSMIDQFVELEGVAYVFVVNPKGEVLAHTFVPSVPGAVRDIKVDNRTTTLQPLSVEGIGEVINVSSPILDGEVGHIHVGMDRKFIRAAIWLAVVQQSFLLALIFFLSLCLTVVMISRIVQPLQKLTDYANALATAGTLASNRAVAGAEVLSIAGRTDEVGQLARAFQYMVDQVSAHEQKLRKAHDELEVRVQERTAELVREIQERKQLEADLVERARALDDANSRLRENADDLERFNRLMVGREERIIELKRQVNALAQELGRTAPFDVSFAE